MLGGRVTLVVECPIWLIGEKGGGRTVIKRMVHHHLRIAGLKRSL